MDPRAEDEEEAWLNDEVLRLRSEINELTCAMRRLDVGAEAVDAIFSVAKDVAAVMTFMKGALPDGWFVASQSPTHLARASTASTSLAGSRVT